ncbi:MAG TPA: type I-U CRISPR-associated helicase/endonuclease Cas3 [Pirellulales bacterium]|nr:type I-U CRISPR-associated helicase/endonuclease Cas3 [Pirellulales bacterium]
MEFAQFYQSLYGFPPFPWQRRLADRFASGWPPQAIAAPTASGKTGVIDAWVWALAFHPNEVSRRLWYVVQRRILVDDAYARAQQIAQRLPEAVRAALMGLSASAEPLNVLRLRGGVFEDMATIDPSTPVVICSTADQHMSRLLFRGYGVSDTSLPLHAALAGTRATIVIDEAHILPTYEANLRRCLGLGADLRVISMTATPGAARDETLSLDESDRTNEVLCRRLSCAKPATLLKGEQPALVKQAKAMLKDGCRAVVVFCNTAETAAGVALLIPRAWLLTGRIREYDRHRLLDALEPLRSGGPGPASPTVVVATQTLEVGADLDFDGLVTECASLSALRQRFGRLNRLGLRERVQAAIVWDGKKQSPVYGSTPNNVFAWLRTLGDAPDMAATSIDEALRVHPPREALDVSPELGPAVTNDLLETWKQTSPRPLWDVPVANYIDPSDDTTATLVWRDEPPSPMLVEAYPPHQQEAAPVPLAAVRRWAGDRIGVR